MTTRLNRGWFVQPCVTALVLSSFGAVLAAVARDFGVFLLFAFPATVGATLAVLAQLIDRRTGKSADDPLSAVQLLSTFGASALRPETGPSAPPAEGGSDAQRGR
jgi:hypothetical protein